ncbi:MAG: SdrD B-like domain-containing protein, partial [Pyrinomonadaceae bacterium]
AKSSAAVAVINPFGLVYEGRGGGAASIAAARVALLRDETSGAPLPLTADAGSAPNEGNDNPFMTDAQGRWSFALAPDQLGVAAAPARYFLNVTAGGYRARMIELTVAPAGTSADGGGLFSLVVRAIDGQPVARDGSFELTTDESVLIDGLAAFALNVPMFENSTLEIAKAADRPSVEIGDVVSYRIDVHNATAAAIDDVSVRDVLPPSFHYAAGTARIENPPDAPRQIEPEDAGDALVFRVGRLSAGARASITYRVRVGVNAGEGEQTNTAVASGTFLSGERTQTAPARAPVRVRRGVFSTQQVVVGRVFEDANGNGRFDAGERPVAGVRLYLSNGQSVVTDASGQYNLPSVNDGSVVISLDPVTLPRGYALAETGTRDGRSWTRLLRTPLGGGALLRQNFAVRPAASATAGEARGGEDARRGAADDKEAQGGKAGGRKDSTILESASTAPTPSPVGLNLAGGAGEAPRKSPNSAPLASGTYEIASTETIEPVAPGAVRVISPVPDEVMASPALVVEAHVAEGWSVALEVEGTRVADSQIGERRVDRKNKLSTFTFVGLSLRPGPNRIRATAVSPEGTPGQTVELTAYGRGPARRLEVVAEKSTLSAGGRDSTRVRVRAFDQWGNPAADAAVALEASAGQLLRSTEERPASGLALTGAGTVETNGVVAEQVTENMRQQMVSLVNGEGTVQLIADNATGAAEIRASTGTIDARTEVRITHEVRPSLLVGLAEASFGRAAPEMSLRNDEGRASGHIALFYRGKLFGDNLLTLAYDSRRPLNRTTGRDRLFQFDPTERAYPLFGDSSTRYEDAPSNSKLYARLDRGRSYFLFGDFETEHKNLGLAGYARKLTGVKAHVENEQGDFISVTGARPDTAFARDVFAGGGLALARLSHRELMPGSEQVVLEVRDRRNPEVIVSREPLV